MKFLHTSDWHLGMPAYFLPDQWRESFARDRVDAVRAIARLATQEGCAFVVVAGDVFDSNDVQVAVVAQALDALAAFAVPVFILPGNHDCLNASSVYSSAAWTAHCPAHVHLITAATPLTLPNAPAIEVLGVPVTTKHPLTDPLAPAYAAPAPAPATQRVVIGHGVVDYLDPAPDKVGVIESQPLRAALASGQIAYVALGDRHSVTEIAQTERRAWYSGTPVSGDYGELDPNRVLLVTLDDGECVVESRQVGEWTFADVQRDVNGEADVAALDAQLSAFPDKPRTVVRLSLRGTLAYATRARLDAVLAHHSDLFAQVKLWERHTTLVNVPGDGDLDSLNVSGYERDAVEELRELALTDARAGDALNLLFRLAQ
jgi:DNA repair exonuclease SbcCD nuclease subunit